MMNNHMKAAILLGVMSGMIFLLGHMIRGYNGVIGAFIVSIVMNCFIYFFSDKIVLSIYRAVPLDRGQYAWIYDVVESLCLEARIPVPKLWYIRSSTPNAFATGRNPSHASVAVTEGILKLLDKRELRGVLAHEISHVKNRDILVSTIAAVMASTISHLSYLARWSALWESSDRKKSDMNVIAVMLVSLFTPIAAGLIQLALSRTRELLADESGAACSGDPIALARALEKIEHGVTQQPLDSENVSYSSTSGLFIMNPFRKSWVRTLFSTHPSTEERVKRLLAMAEKQR